MSESDIVVTKLNVARLATDPATAPHWLRRETPPEEAEAFRLLLVEQNERGERHGWAYHQFIERFGHRPDVFRP